LVAVSALLRARVFERHEQSQRPATTWRDTPSGCKTPPLNRGKRNFVDPE